MLGFVVRVGHRGHEEEDPDATNEGEWDLHIEHRSPRKGMLQCCCENTTKCLYWD